MAHSFWLTYWGYIMLGKILVTIFFPIIALLDWTFSNYPLSQFWEVNRKEYKDFMEGK
jgi:hypothetical protein